MEEQVINYKVMLQNKTKQKKPAGVGGVGGEDNEYGKTPRSKY